MSARIVLFILLFGFPAHAAEKSWSEKMRGLAKTLQELLIDVNSDERFNSPKNFKRIEKNAEEFSKLAHELKTPKSEKGAPPDGDPSIQIIAGQFAQEADQAYKTLRWGHRTYARNLLRSMTSYCMACHTRNSSGPSFTGMTDLPVVQNLNSLEKADYFASTRQFDRALDQYEKILAESGSAESRPFDYERAIRSGLAISVRVKRDPDRALSIVDRLLADKKAPFYLKEQASQWKESLKTWKSESLGKAQTEEGYYSQAIRLIAAAKSLQKYPADRSADILYLRASSAVHDLMGFAPNGVHAADALYLAGLCYEVLHDLNLWDLHEFYYLSCIYKSPHTEKARACFGRYQESVYAGYTGSAGTHLPPEISEKLRNLDRMSNPEKLQ